MPTDMWGSGYELVPGYGVVAQIGLRSANQFWIRFQAVATESPITRAALQFLRLNLPSKAYPGSEIGNDLDFSTAIKLLATSYSEIKNVVNGFDNEARRKGACQQADLSRSFIRLTNPIFKKYGGGHRVKRVELFDNWNAMTGQKEASYGQEYSYTTSEEVNGQAITISSGVASYEPMIGNEENPFREPIEYAERLAPLAPVNYLFVEAPVCESYFPSASVGYSKVSVRTINRKAKSANGWDETSFYTTRDFPTLVAYSTFDPASKKRYNPKLTALLKINAKNYITLSQGFKVELNDMNGKMKSQVSYPETDSLHPVRASYYYYKTDNPNAHQLHLNNTVSVVDSLNGHINSSAMIGEDIEVMADLRQQSSKTVSQQYSPNIDVIPLPLFGIPFPIPSFWPLPQIENTKFNSAATVKVIQRYGILDSVVVIDKGSVVSTKNLVYDGETGDAIVSRTNNEFNDPVYNFNYPAYWAYSGMGPSYQNIDAVFYKKNIMCVNGKLFNAFDRSDFPVKRYFESGDELWVRSTKTVPLDPGCAVNNIDVSAKARKLWVMDARKGLENKTGLYLIDAAGVPYSGMIDSLKIIRSGKRNMINASAGSITSLASPVREVTPGNFRIVIDTASHVIQTAATAYKDLWQVENSMYQKDTVIQVYDTFTVNPAIDVTTFRRQRVNEGDDELISTGENVVIHSPNVASSFDYRTPSHGLRCGWSYKLFTKSILNFDTTSIPNGSTIISAILNLSPKIPFDLWVQKSVKRGGPKGCGHSKTYDWSKANNYYAGNFTASLSRVSTQWNYQTPYISLISSTNNQVGVSYTNFQQLNCTAMFQDMVNQDTKNGIMFEVASTDAGINYLDFCAGNYNNVNNVNNSNCSGGATLSKSISPSIPCDCFAPQLTITYRALVDTTIQVCRPNIVDTAVNPYRWGILGNWRMDRAYTYYHDRTESDASITQTNIRKEGTLKNFTPYWQFTDTVLLANPDTTKWVWNSALSMYNRKGFEIENYDPLGRYNSGLYGYNETLPLTVSQNSRYRQSLFDGFEDYGYKSQNCTICPSPREVDFTAGNNNVSISVAQSHTGLYSLLVNAGTQSNLTVPVVPDSVGKLTASLSMKIDSTPITTTTVTGKGTGITGNYFGYSPGSPQCGTGYSITNYDTAINFNWGYQSPYPGPVCASNYQATWTGYLQAPSTDNFTFYASADYSIFVKIGSQVIFQGAPGRSIPIYLIAGNLYPVTIQYTHRGTGYSFVQLDWSSSTIPEQIVPKLFLYPENMSAADTTGSVMTTVIKYCINVHNVQPVNVIRPAFSPYQGDHMALSAWVRIDAPDCNTLPALANVVKVSFDNGGTNPVYLQQTGVRIEGWQRYESEVLIPANASAMYISAIAPSGNNIFIDDIKMQPFNSSTKSFVYNPVNLRLMAELDENNYATFYEYDDDGTLIRVKKETERGIMTIKETRSALIKGN